MHTQSDTFVREEHRFSSIDEMSLDLLSSSLKIRNQLFEEARRRKSGVNSGGGGAWIPELSRLAGKLMDLFAVQIIEDYASRNEDKSDEIRRIENEDDNDRRIKGYKKAFNPQEMASALWAFGKLYYFSPLIVVIYY